MHTDRNAIAVEHWNKHSAPPSAVVEHSHITWDDNWHGRIEVGSDARHYFGIATVVISEGGATTVTGPKPTGRRPR